MDTTSKKIRISSLYITILLIILISFLSVVCVLWKYWSTFNEYGLSASTESWGQFGDYVGGLLNPIFGFFSIILLCITLNTSFRLGARQTFESTLFELIRLHRENLFSLEVKYEEETIVGRECFLEYLDEISFKYKLLSDDSIQESERLKHACEEFFNEISNKSGLGHYYRNLYLIYKHIDESYAIKKSEKEKYAKIVRAQISSLETDILMLNGLTDKGGSFRKYIEKYSLLQEIGLDSLSRVGASEKTLLNIYHKMAYHDK